MASTAITNTNVVGTLESTGMFSTVKGTDQASRVKVFNAVNSADSISEGIEKGKGKFTITVSDIIVQMIEVVNEVSGESEAAPRVIFIDPDGKAYSATSKGLLSSVRNIIGIVGDPSTWDEPLTIDIVEKRGRNGYRFMTVEIA